MGTMTDEMKSWFTETSQTYKKTKLVRCKVCQWALTNYETHNIQVDEEYINKTYRKEAARLAGHLNKCKYKAFASHVPGVLLEVGTPTSTSRASNNL
jgi:hypothetical protein